MSAEKMMLKKPEKSNDGLTQTVALDRVSYFRDLACEAGSVSPTAESDDGFLGTDRIVTKPGCGKP